MGEYIYHNGQIYSAKEWLDYLGLAAHYTITTSGVICQHINDMTMGAHAKGHNKNTVGIEFLLAGVWVNDPFRKRIQTPYLYGDQYTAGVKLCRMLKSEGIKEFYRHSTIDTRIENGVKVKVDPGDGFPLKAFSQDAGITIK